MLKLFISMAALFLGVGSSVFAQIEGKVYIDANGNGICDAGERGLKGVCVQDGLNVVKTTDDGHFILPGHKDTRFVTLTVPDGYQASTSHYLSFDGTGKKYELGICKTSVNTGNGYSFVQITDTETSLYGDWIDNLKEYVKTNPTAFIIHTGDICYEAHQDFHGRYLRSVDLGIPTYYCVGNHDLRAGKYGEELWQSHFGPSWYSFDVGNVHYVVTPMLGGDHAPSYRRSDIIRWLKNDLAQTDKGKRIVLFNHDLWFWGDDLLFKDKNGEQIDFADYNLDAIIAVGYRVNSKKATMFRIWANRVLKEFIIKGYVMDDARLREPENLFGKDYFEEQLERIRDIRSSERRFYQKITDIYSQCSADYDVNSPVTKEFFATVQNKLHYAVTHHTAAEIVYGRADSTKPNMGLTTWKNAPQGRIRKSDVSIAKNYLNEEEMINLNEIVTMYLDYAERQARRGNIMYMQDWVNRLDAFLQFNEEDILHDKGKVTAAIAKAFAESEFEKFRVLQDRTYQSDFDRLVANIEENSKQTK